MPLNIDNIKKKIEELEVLADSIERCGVILLEQAPIELYEVPDYDEDAIRWGATPPELREQQYNVVIQYQHWYSIAHQIIIDYIPERSEEFVKCYATTRNASSWGATGMGVIHYLRFSCHAMGSKELVKQFANDFILQRSILLSLPDVIEVKQLGLRRTITADIARSEVEQAELLFEGGFHRAAGSIAGVALELHLKTLCDINAVGYPAKATMGRIIQELYKAGKLDDTQEKHWQYLASIRNQCSHSKDVSERDIHILIVEVRKLI